jgi:hypothetical protein
LKYPHFDCVRKLGTRAIQQKRRKEKSSIPECFGINEPTPLAAYTRSYVYQVKDAQKASQSVTSVGITPSLGHLSRRKEISLPLLPQKIAANYPFFPQC